MAQPTPYARDFAFEPLAPANVPEAGERLNGELDAIKLTTDEICENLALIQRDDGKLRNQSVHPDSLSPAVRAIIAGGWALRGPWATATAYAPKDVVAQGDVLYVCVAAHTSGTFATDNAAGRWLEFYDQSLLPADGTITYNMLTSVAIDRIVQEVNDRFAPASGTEGYRLQARTVVSSPVASVDFAIPADALGFIIEFSDVQPVTDNSNLALRVSVDGGATYLATSSYFSIGGQLGVLGPNGGYAGAFGTGAATQMGVTGPIRSGGIDTARGNIEMDAKAFPQALWRSGRVRVVEQGPIVGAGYVSASTRPTHVRLFMSVGNIATGDFRLLVLYPGVVVGGPGAITGSGLTMSTNRLLGRTTASTGAIEEISVGTGLALSAGVLSATGGSARSIVKCLKSANQSIADATWTLITWDQEEYDTDSAHDNVTNNSRIVVPAGKTRARFHFFAGASYTGSALVHLRLNAAGSQASGTPLATRTCGTFSSFFGDDVLWEGAVTPGDYAEAFVYCSPAMTLAGPSPSGGSGRSFFLAEFW